MSKESEIYVNTTPEMTKAKETLTPEMMEAWRNFSRTVFKEGVLPEKVKQLIAVAVAHVTQCPYCIRSHTRLAMRKGATKQEILEAIWIAAEMKAGAVTAHSAIALDEIENLEK